MSQRFRDLPLFSKLLIPFLVLMLSTGVLGAWLIVRDLSTRAQTALDESLSRRALDARSIAHDRELYLVESANFAANLRGMAAAVREHRTGTTVRLLGSVAALKQDLSVLAVTDRHAVALAEYDRTDGSSRPAAHVSSFATTRLVTNVLTRRDGEKAAGFIGTARRPLLAVVSPICPADPCTPIGAAIAAYDVRSLVRQMTVAGTEGAAVYSPSGGLLAASGLPAAGPAPQLAPAAPGTVQRRAGGTASLFAPYVVDGHPAGSLAVSVATGPAFASARRAAEGLAGILFAAIVGVLAIGALLSRMILRQVRPLIETNRRLAAGDLTARAPVLGRDELGQLAAGVNDMAADLEASYTTLEQRVAARTAEVEQLLRERTDLFTAISHDFRTPLAIMLSQADLLLDPDIPKDQSLSRDVGRTVKASAAQLLARINDILELARAERGDLPVTLGLLRVSAVFGELMDSVTSLASHSGVHVTVEHVPSSVTVVADAGRLMQALLNLLDNAVKYTPTGGTVTLAARRVGPVVEIRVADTGVGIPAGAGDRVFEPFYRVEGTHPARQEPSSGLGLAVTKRLVEAQGGDITYESTPAGTVFVLSLPSASKQPRQPRKAGARTGK